MDVRELILLRIMAVGAFIHGSNGIFRNLTDVAEARRPCVILLDGDEEALPDPNRSGNSPRRIRMEPQLVLLLGSSAAEIGTDLNAMRIAAIYAITHDAELLGLSLNGRECVYEGAQSIIEDGRKVEGAIVLRFAITYLLRPGDLASSG